MVKKTSLAGHTPAKRPSFTEEHFEKGRRIGEIGPPARDPDRGIHRLHVLHGHLNLLYRDRADDPEFTPPCFLNHLTDRVIRTALEYLEFNCGQAPSGGETRFGQQAARGVLDRMKQVGVLRSELRSEDAPEGEGKVGRRYRITVRPTGGGTQVEGIHKAVGRNVPTDRSRLRTYCASLSPSHEGKCRASLAVPRNPLMHHNRCRNLTSRLHHENCPFQYSTK